MAYYLRFSSAQILKEYLLFLWVVPDNSVRRNEAEVFEDFISYGSNMDPPNQT
jgi:hypothetical protein